MRDGLDRLNEVMTAVGDLHEGGGGYDWTLSGRVYTTSLAILKAAHVGEQEEMRLCWKSFEGVGDGLMGDGGVSPPSCYINHN